MREEKLQAKAQTVEEIKGKVQEAHSIVFVNYSKLSVADATELRAQCREVGVDYKVYKNTMMKRAFEELGYDEAVYDYLKGPSAAAFSMEDPVAAAKVTQKFADDHDSIEIKAGLVGNKIISIDEIKELSKLPSKEVLVAQVLGGLNAPIQGLANVLTGNLRGLAVVLNAIAEKKEQEATA
jgi:large subunit ribosomal protein L10